MSSTCIATSSHCNLVCHPMATLLGCPNPSKAAAPLRSRLSRLFKRRLHASMLPQSAPAPSSLRTWRRATCCPRQGCTADDASCYAAACVCSRHAIHPQRAAARTSTLSACNGKMHARRPAIPCRAARALTPRCCGGACGGASWWRRAASRVSRAGTDGRALCGHFAGWRACCDVMHAVR